MNKNATLLQGISKKNKKKNIELEKNVILANFDLSGLDKEYKSFLQEQTIKIQSATTKMYTELGKIFKNTQNELSNNRSGVFEKWYTALGFKKNAVYRLMNRYEFIVANCNNKNYIESLPVSLTYELSKETANKELVELVLNKEITTLKEFKEYNSLEDKQEKIVHNLVDDSFDKMLNAFNKNLKNSYKKLENDKKNQLNELIIEFNKKVDELLN